jgi:two-component system LytT family response regulator
MPEMDGFGVLENIEAEQLPVIVFVTAFDHYALKAFEFHALDYLLKPFDDARFEKALRQAKRQIEQREVKDLSWWPCLRAVRAKPSRLAAGKSTFPGC